LRKEISMNFQEAAAEFKRFLKSLHFTATPDFTVTSNLYSFAEESGEGMMLIGDEADEFARCLDHFVEANEVESGLFSRRGLKELMRNTLIKAGSPEEGESQLTEAKVRAALKVLRDGLRAKPKRYIVYLPVQGVDPANLPVTVGKVTFYAGNSQHLVDLQAYLKSGIDTWTNDQSSKDGFGAWTAKAVRQHLQSQVVAAVEVESGDDDNASFKALAICRDTLDVINFFADAMYGENMKACVSVVGEGQPVESQLTDEDKRKLVITLREKYEEADYVVPLKTGDSERQIAALHQRIVASGPLIGLRIPKNDASPSRAELNRVFARLSELMTKDEPTEIEERVLAAIRWAGRATVKRRREEAFLLYAISLESLVLGREKNAEITYRLKLWTAHLLKQDAAGRKKLGDRLKELYDIRSAIVHAGSFDVKERQLHDMRRYAKQAALTVLMASHFQHIKTNNELNQWLENSVLGGSPAAKPEEAMAAQQEPESV
jgi:hypothetical protein